MARPADFTGQPPLCPVFLTVLPAPTPRNGEPASDTQLIPRMGRELVRSPTPARVRAPQCSNLGSVNSPAGTLGFTARNRNPRKPAFLLLGKCGGVRFSSRDSRKVSWGREVKRVIPPY